MLLLSYGQLRDCRGLAVGVWGIVTRGCALVTHGGLLGPSRAPGCCTITHDNHGIAIGRIYGQVSRHSSCSGKRLRNYVNRFLLRVIGMLSRKGVTRVNSLNGFHVDVGANAPASAMGRFGASYVSGNGMLFCPKDSLHGLYGALSCALCGGSSSTSSSGSPLPSSNSSGRKNSNDKMAPSPSMWSASYY